MNEQLKILEMIEKGQITAAEGMELLEALNTTKETEANRNIEPAAGMKRKYKFFRVRVTSEDKSVNVNGNIPIRLISTIGKFADKIPAIIPADARKEMEAKGIDISSIDFAEIIEEILNGTLEDPDIVDVEAWDDDHKAMVKVRVYVD